MFFKLGVILVCILECYAQENLFATDTLEDTYGKILHASVVFRHGERTPYAPYPLDPYKHYQWPEGFGQLTKDGKKRLYELGKWFKHRYSNLVRQDYWFQDIRMDSSDVDRTLMSAECFLAGFYPPSDEEMWTEEIRWQPVPVHTVPFEHDNVIQMTKICKLLVEEYFVTYRPIYSEYYADHRSTLDYIATHTGHIFNEKFPFYVALQLMEIFDTLNIEVQNNLTLLEWTDEVFPEPLSSMAIKLFEFANWSHNMKKIRAGPFLDQLSSDIDGKMKGTLEQNAHFYSSHDMTIATIMISLGILNEKLPPYGASLIFELRETEIEHYVTVLYKNETDHPPYLLRLPECKNLACTAEEFSKIAQSLITKDWEEMCDPAKANQILNMWPFTQGQTAILIGVVCFLLSAMYYFSDQRRNQKLQKAD